MANDGLRVPHVASLRAWERLGFPNRHALREAIRRGDLRAFRTGKRTIRVTYLDLLRWLERSAVEPVASEARVSRDRHSDAHQTRETGQ